MEKDLIKAKDLLNSKNLTLAVVKEGKVLLESKEKGVRSLLEAFKDLEHSHIADKLVGKAAAFLMVSAGVRSIYTPIMSREAINVFSKSNINFYFDYEVKYINNRARNGICPLEKLCLSIENPEKALHAINLFIKGGKQ